MSKETEELEAWLKKVGPSTVTKVGGSDVFLSLFTKGYEEDPLAVLQFGYAVMMDKPIYLVVPKGTKLPESVKRIARVIEYYKDSDLEGLQDATRRCVEHFHKHA